jgi:hypothetical protein
MVVMMLVMGKVSLEWELSHIEHRTLLDYDFSGIYNTFYALSGRARDGEFVRNEAR